MKVALLRSARARRPRLWRRRLSGGLALLYLLGALQFGAPLAGLGAALAERPASTDQVHHALPAVATAEAEMSEVSEIDSCCAPAKPAKPVKAYFPCEGHGCGCKTAEDCAAHCCCFPDAVAPTSASDRDQMAGGWDAAYRALHCGTDRPTDAATTPPALHPHPPAGEQPLVPASPFGGYATPHTASLQGVDLTPPGKVPIQGCLAIA